MLTSSAAAGVAATSSAIDASAPNSDRRMRLGRKMHSVQVVITFMANLCRWLSKQLSRDHDRQGAPKGKPTPSFVPIRRKAGGRYAADLVLQLPARGPVPLLFVRHPSVRSG